MKDLHFEWENHTVNINVISCLQGQTQTIYLLALLQLRLLKKGDPCMPKGWLSDLANRNIGGQIRLE